MVARTSSARSRFLTVVRTRATLANAVLQSNNNYQRNVRPRVERIREEYARETSLQDIKRLLDKITAQEFLHWNGTRSPKPSTI